MTLSLLLTD